MYTKPCNVTITIIEVRPIVLSVASAQPVATNYHLIVFGYSESINSDHLSSTEMFIADDLSTEEQEVNMTDTCKTILDTVSDVRKSEYKIQLIVATPGSGSDWCRITIALLTGCSLLEYKNFQLLINKLS